MPYGRRRLATGRGWAMLRTSTAAKGAAAIALGIVMASSPALGQGASTPRSTRATIPEQRGDAPVTTRPASSRNAPSTSIPEAPGRQDDDVAARTGIPCPPTGRPTDARPMAVQIGADRSLSAFPAEVLDAKWLRGQAKSVGTGFSTNGAPLEVSSDLISVSVTSPSFTAPGTRDGTSGRVVRGDPKSSDQMISEGLGSSGRILFISNSANDIAFSLDHSFNCRGANARVTFVATTDDGIRVDLRDGDNGWRPVLMISKPWAFDANGKAVPTRYEIEGSRITQIIETSKATKLPVLADPNYTVNYCSNGFYAGASPNDYILDGDCPVAGIFNSIRGYMPVWASSDQLPYPAVVRADGACGVIPDTAGWYDFQIPCKAHDYCYDLIRAGFTGVTESGCNNIFYQMMWDHCANRSFLTQQQCNASRATVIAFVNASSVTQSPGWVKIRPVHDYLCLDVSYAWTGNRSGSYGLIGQYGCYGYEHQKFQFTPTATGAVFPFTIHPKHAPAMCVDSDLNATGPYGFRYAQQWSCSGGTNQQFYLTGASYQNKYTIRIVSSGVWAPGYTNDCLDVPWSSPNWGEALIRWGCAESNNQLFYVEPA